MDIKPGGVVFVRCNLSAGNNKKVKLHSQEKIVSSESDTITWNQTFSLDCSGDHESINWLRKEALVFELRWRSFIGRIIGGSKLVGRGEIPWGTFLDSTNVEIEKWVSMIPQNGRLDDDELPAVQIALKIQESDHGEVVEREKVCEGSRACMDYCGCKSCVYYEFFAIEAALEAP